MSKKAMYEIATISSSGNSNYLRPRSKYGGMAIIRCLCGTEILLVPDINAMNRAIENHVHEHKEQNKSAEKENVPPSRIRQILIEQILIVASEFH